MNRFITYFRNRISERTTWAAITLAITSAATMQKPWSWAFIAASVLAALAPMSGPKA
ncbi:hypothetical protein [Sphingomonas sp. IC081]|uniref:hypothetical protein n=1 Tax=Sphingomonas sp. IC081 TaxID=304378 RepID=UPI00163C7EF3|nr:hypothetical protein [Sphingomonas sp. IC081]